MKSNREHVLPKWALRLTGSYHRETFLYGATRPYSTLHVASCEACNTRYGEDLETRAECLVHALLAREPVAEADLEILLDWLDKVRIGLWWQTLQVAKNPLGIKPKFAISERVAAHDRMMVIYQAEQSPMGLTAFGVESVPFMSMPSCFGLKINNLFLVSISAPFVLAYEFGFPAPVGHVLGAGDRQDLMDLSGDTGRLADGFITLPYDKRGSQIVQPIFGQVHESAKSLFSSPYVAQYVREAKSGKCYVMHVKDGSPIRYPSTPTTLWRPPLESDCDALVDRVRVSVYSVQLAMFYNPLLAPRLPHNRDAWPRAV